MNSSRYPINRYRYVLSIGSNAEDLVFVCEHCNRLIAFGDVDMGLSHDHKYPCNEKTA
jgi:hypothetical protein